MVQAFLEKTQDINLYVNNVKRYITEHDCKNLSLDISHLNFFDAGKVSALCSAYHWSKYPDGEFTLKTKSKNLKDFVSPVCVGNVNVIVS